MQEHKLLAQAFTFSEEVISQMHGQCMHYLHGYVMAYQPATALSAEPVRLGLLLTAILGLALKVVYQDLIIDYLPIREQLALFDIQIPQNIECTQTTTNDCEAHNLKVSPQHAATEMQIENLPASRDTTASLNAVQETPDADMEEADEALLDPKLESSDPDLYHAKLQFE